MLPPAAGKTAKNWRVYRSRFVEPVRIRAGLRFWQDNAETLARAERDYGVPAEVIVGIIGVETIYGQQMGSFRVMDALATLSFDFPDAHPRAAERRAFFQGELEQFLSLMDRSGTDPFSPRGSYAGAMGLGQFMPSSWVRWAVDYDGDGRIDLWNSPADAIGSVANYFKATAGRPACRCGSTCSSTPRGCSCRCCWRPTSCPPSPPRAWPSWAPSPGSGATHAGPLALVELQNGGDVPTYVIVPRTSTPSHATTGPATTPWRWMRWGAR